MKTKQILSAFFFATLSICNAQTGFIQWQKSTGGSGYDFGYSICPTTDGGSITTGYTESSDGDISSNHGNGDLWVVRQDAGGNIIWEKTYGGTGMDYGYSIQQTTDGGSIVCGYTESNNGDVSYQKGYGDCWVLKLDPNGNLMWEKTIGGTQFDNGQSVRATPDHGYIIAGYTTSSNIDITSNHGAGDFMLAKLDATGNIMWTKTFGGTSYDYSQYINVTSDGGYVIAGSTGSHDGDLTGNNGNTDGWIIKTDAFGTLQWQHNYGGSAYDALMSVMQTSDGGFIAAGNSESNDLDATGSRGNGDCWILKLDNTGNISWHKNYGSINNDYAYSIKQESSGYVFAGYSEGNTADVTGNHGDLDTWVAQMDNAGNLISQYSLGGSSTDIAYDLQLTSTGYLITGYSTSNDGDVSSNHGGGDAWMIRSDRSTTGITSTAAVSPAVQVCNPCNDSITFTGLETGSTVDMFDMSGKCVFHSISENDMLICDRQGMTKGMYVYTIQSKEKAVKGKVVLQ